jgi:1,4-alpha-glucan branching enzyme
MAIGYVALVLHAHLPFVRHPESDYVLEEEWLYEAITETYIPLLRVLKDSSKMGLILKSP